MWKISQLPRDVKRVSLAETQIVETILSTIKHRLGSALNTLSYWAQRSPLTPTEEIRER